MAVCLQILALCQLSSLPPAPDPFFHRCLEDIRALFPPEWQPFYAGFGNRDTDEISYLAVGVPAAKILIINNRSACYASHSSL